MITTPLAVQQFTDQLLAVLRHHGPSTTEEIIGHVGPVICHCEGCGGRPRPALPVEVQRYLCQALIERHVRGQVVEDGEAYCDGCGRMHHRLTIRWERTD